MKQFLCNVLTGHFKKLYIQTQDLFPFLEKVIWFVNAKYLVKCTQRLSRNGSVDNKQTNNKWITNINENNNERKS